MKSRNYKSIVNQKNRYALFFALPAIGLIAASIATLSFCSSSSAEIYEVFENGQVYLVDVQEPPLGTASSGKSSNQLSDDIADKLEHMNNRLIKLAELAGDKKLKLLNKNQENRLKNQIVRSNNANKKLKNSKAFREVGKKHKFKDNPSQASLYQADPYYAGAGPPDDENDYETDGMYDLLDMIEDVNSLMEDTEVELERLNEIEELKQQAAMIIANGEDPHEVYTRLQELMNNSPVTTGFYIGFKVAKIAAVASKTADDILDRLFNQDVAGFNSSAGGVILAAITGALEIIAEALEIKLDYDNSEISDASYNCIIQIGKEHAEMASDLAGMNVQMVTLQTDANSLGSGIDVLVAQVNVTDAKVDYLVETTDTINAKIDALSQQVADMNQLMKDRFDAMTALSNQRFGYIEKLLCTPHGLRPSFPKK